ncbi:uncharacterized protein [Rutidosis leptorrhynchoides]|uniref:uncharacterized protein n=1 Tax=Rutidosis leptorrhynchoides TaxID=125765 RepID=UPI003A991B9D
METLMVYTQNKNQYHTRIDVSNRNYNTINCRALQSRYAGILPNPNFVHKQVPYNQNPKHSIDLTRSSAVSIPRSISDSMSELVYSELWAGPAYSNSPPPSSLPIPSFSVKPKRSVSLDLHSVSDSDSDSDVDLSSLITRSAPSSPRSECFEMELFSNRDDDLVAATATKTLCRILNIDRIEN